MDNDVDLTRIEDRLVEALEHLRQGRDLLSVPCHEALGAAQVCILNALEEVNRLQRHEVEKQPEDGVKQSDDGVRHKDPAA